MNTGKCAFLIGVLALTFAAREAAAKQVTLRVATPFATARAAAVGGHDGNDSQRCSHSRSG
jgi:hypothetical protein